MLRWLRSGLLLRILGALLIVSVLPIYLIRQFSQQLYEDTRMDVVSQSQSALDEKAIQGLQSRAVALANAVSNFLAEREGDVRFLSAQTPDVQTYLNFSSQKTGILWTIDETGGEIRFPMPIYREIAFVDLNGREQIKVSNECRAYPLDCAMVEGAMLKDVSRPSNTLYLSETYFKDSLALKSGDVFVGNPIGFHLSSDVAYAGTQYRSGERYRGVLRFAAPVFEGGRRVGTLVTAVEMLHLLEFTAHIAPSNSLPQAEIDAREADFSYMISPEGWAITHPRHFNIYGVDEKGQPVKAISEEDQDQPDNLDRPGNLTLMRFIDPAFPDLVRRNRLGQNGILRAQPWGKDERRVLIYATIPYKTGQYNTSAGFGLIILSTDADRLHIDAEVLSNQFNSRIRSLSQYSFQIITGTLALVILLAVTLARFIVSPILRLTEEAKIIEAGNWKQVNTAELQKTGGGAEIGQLARVFASMAKQIYERETTLRKQVESLKIVIDETKRKKAVEELTENEFFQDLAKRASEIRSRTKPSSGSKS
ncbi:MAG TPA: HAMP domain-containing protein [Anaerolineales bacterium]|nr:HAMP domain-containing protein [Anaerolineales bacterium]